MAPNNYSRDCMDRQRSVELYHCSDLSHRGRTTSGNPIRTLDRLRIDVRTWSSEQIVNEQPAAIVKRTFHRATDFIRVRAPRMARLCAESTSYA